MCGNPEDFSVKRGLPDVERAEEIMYMYVPAFTREGRDVIRFATLKRGRLCQDPLSQERPSGGRGMPK